MLSDYSDATAQLGIQSPWDDDILANTGTDQNLYWLTKAIIARESAWNPNAQNPADPSVGLMQILVGAGGPAPGLTADSLLDPMTNITVGVSFLRTLEAQYPLLSDTISAYNAGHPLPDGAGGYLNPGNYVNDVLAYYAFYQAADLGTVAPPASDGAATYSDAGVAVAESGSTPVLTDGSASVVQSTPATATDLTGLAVLVLIGLGIYWFGRRR